MAGAQAGRANRCACCDHPLAKGRQFAFAAPDGASSLTHCLRCAARHPTIVRRAGRVALVVGVVLTAINQGDAIIAGQLTASHLWKIPLTSLVPYSVSTYAALGALRQSTSRPISGEDKIVSANEEASARITTK